MSHERKNPTGQDGVDSQSRTSSSPTPALYADNLVGHTDRPPVSRHDEAIEFMQELEQIQDSLVAELKQLKQKRCDRLFQWTINNFDLHGTPLADIKALQGMMDSLQVTEVSLHHAADDLAALKSKYLTRERCSLLEGGES
jgi:hypothetical protein